MTLAKWKGAEAYLMDESRWGERKYSWTTRKDEATRFRDFKEATSAFRDSGAGSDDKLELVEV